VSNRVGVNFEVLVDLTDGITISLSLCQSVVRSAGS
jgi:hypothetical protein